MQVLRYLGRYTHRVAISNHRLLAFEQERVTFRWKDYAHGGKQGKMTLGANEFLRRFFLHVLPRGFVRIRHFGFLANRFRASRLALSRQLLSSPPSTLGETGTCNTPAETCGRARNDAGQKSASRRSSIDLPEARLWITSGLPDDPPTRPAPAMILIILSLVAALIARYPFAVAARSPS